MTTVQQLRGLISDGHVPFPLTGHYMEIADIPYVSGKLVQNGFARCNEHSYKTKVKDFDTIVVITFKDYSKYDCVIWTNSYPTKTEICKKTQ